MSKFVWEYIGPWDNVGPCKHHRSNCGKGTDVCTDGSCPGTIDGKCAFYGDAVPKGAARDKFRIRRMRV